MISAIFQILKQQALLKTLGGERVEMKLGAEFRDENQPAPRIVCWPTADTVKTEIPRGRPLNKPSVHVRSAGTRWHLYAVGKCNRGESMEERAIADIAATEQLLSNLLFVVHQCLQGAYRIGGVDWIQQDGEAVAELGRVCLVDIVFEVPVYPELTLPTFRPTVVAQLPFVAEMRFPQGDGTTKIETGNPSP